MEDKYYYYLFWINLMISYIVVVIVLKMMVINLWWRPRKIEQHFSKQGIKGPPYHFFDGNTKELLCLMSKASSQPHHLSHNILPRVLPFYHHWKKIYGATFLVWFGPTARLTISDPVLIREIFILKSDLFEKNDSPHLLRKVEGDGLLTLKGQKWAHHRKIIRPTFHFENLKLMIPMIGKNIAKMMEKWLEMSTSCGKMEIEISEWFTTLTQEVIMHTAFGTSSEDGRAIFELQTQQMAFAIDSFNNVHIPGHRFLPTKKNRKCWRLDNEMRNYLVKLIHERIRDSASNQVSDECPNDLLEVMIRAKMRGTNDGTSPKSKSMSMSSTRITVHDIVEECKTFFFAGKQTVSNLMTWTTILLAMHPQWQELARAEVLTVCGSRDVPSKDDLPKLKMLGMILNESLRLYPPTVATIRRAKADVQLGGYMIPRGTELLIPIIAVHHDQALWGHDATEFNPARFTHGVTRATKHPMAFMPFGLGPRQCIGQNLATLQAKLTMAMILQRFSFDLGQSYQHAPTVLMLLYPQYGAPIIFRKLKTHKL